MKSGWFRLSLLATAALALLLAASCAAGGAGVSGTLYIDPADIGSFSGTRTGFVVLDGDTNPDNGNVVEEAISLTDGDLDSIEAISYLVADVPAGTYYLYAYFDMDANGFDTAPPDVWGYFGRASFSNPPSSGTASVIEVPEAGFVSFDLWISNISHYM